MPALAYRRDAPVSAHLDAFRGVAALLVAISHLRALFFVEYNQVTHKSAAVKLLYLVTGLGHEAVVIFFVLSGFFISSSVIRTIQSNRWNWGTYSTIRLTRLYVVLTPALLIGFLWDRLGMRMTHETGVYAGVAYYQHIIPVAISHLLTLKIWLGNMLYLQGITVPTFGSNGPLWSLSYEFWYYLLFPLCLLALLRQNKLVQRVAYATLVLIIIKFVGFRIALYFLIWLMGCAVSIAAPSKIGKSVLFRLGAATALLLAFGLSRLHPAGNGIASDFLIGLAFSALMYALLCSDLKALSVSYTKIARYLSETSYTLYLVHVPLLVFLNSLLIGRHSLWQPSLFSYVSATGLAVVTLFYAFVIWRMAESRTDRVRSYFLRLITKLANRNKLSLQDVNTSSEHLLPRTTVEL